MASWCSGRPMHAPPHLSAITPRLPSKRRQCLSAWTQIVPNLRGWNNGHCLSPLLFPSDSQCCDALGPVSWRPTTIKWQQSSQSNRHSTISTRQTEYHKGYHRQQTTRWGVSACSPTMVTLHGTGFVECRWWNDGWTVKTVVTWRSSASMIPAPGLSVFRKFNPQEALLEQSETTLLLVFLSSFLWHQFFSWVYAWRIREVIWACFIEVG